MKAKALYADIRERLKSAGIAEAENEALIFLETYLGITRSDIILDEEKEPEAESLNALGSALSRREKREPLQYITNNAPFMGLDFYVDERVLIPRPDTELLVEEALKDLHGGSRILDICTGSGCILISLLKYSNDCMGVGTDLSEGALEVAKKNAGEILGDNDRIRFFKGDLFEALEGTGSKFEVIVSNPPYIASGEIPNLMPEVKDHEPGMALDGKENGLFFYERIIPKAKEYLTVGGTLFLETGYDQGPAVAGLMENEGYIEIKVLKDYSGNDRVVTGVRSVKG
ncbi:MAG: peptide chain release factor N(5)-glutamine methyltransferase [Lachnospiraceae bacterium]|nr:peptide chain release factor N(5)-glutamine methyltransferase [Lachnospiraceae bacterium]